MAEDDDGIFGTEGIHQGGDISCWDQPKSLRVCVNGSIRGPRGGATMSPRQSERLAFREQETFACPYRKLYPTGALPRIRRCSVSWGTCSN
jgi:hypothetical protein